MFVCITARARVCAVRAMFAACAENGVETLYAQWNALAGVLFAVGTATVCSLAGACAR